MDYMMMQGEMPQDEGAQTIKREVDAEMSKARAALVKQWDSDITEAKAHFKPAFDQMRSDMKFAKGEQWEGNKGAYVANLTLRHINQRVASIYAKNPTAIATRKKRLDFKIWDGSKKTLDDALMQVQTAMQTGELPPPQIIALLEDVEMGKQKRAMLEKLGKTLEIVFKYSLDEPMPRFKAQAKQLIRRVVTTGVGYVKLGYQRATKQAPEVESEIKDHSSKIAEIEMLLQDVADDKLRECEAKMEELRIGLAELQAMPEIIVRDGLIFDFPKSTQIIIDPACTQLQGFVGANWIAHEFVFTPDDVKRIYSVDVKSQFTAYDKEGKKTKANGKQKNCLVWEIYDLKNQTVYTVCNGYPDFLKQGQPDVKLEQFHPFFTLTFNDVECEDSIYPPSDVQLIRPMQLEHNRAREGVREHRISNRPAWITAKGTFEASDKNKMSDHAINELIELSIERGVDVRTLLQPKPNNPIDPAVYDTNYLFEDIQRSLGSQEADFGGTSGATATESSIAEGTRISSVSSNIDDLDEFLSNMAKAAGQILLVEMDEQTVKKIAGDGAVWAQYTSTEIAEELYLEIKAGSSGKPNKQLDLANMERAYPFLIQLPNINPEMLAKKLLEALDSNFNLEDAIISGMPSIVAMNANAQMATGDPSTDPNMQGNKGANNAAQADKTAGGAQPAYPAPQ